MKKHISSILALIAVLGAALIFTSGCVVRTRAYPTVYADASPPARISYGGYDLHYRSNAYYYYDGGTWLLAPTVPSYLVRYHRPYYTGYRTYSRPYTTTYRPTQRYTTTQRPATSPNRRVTNTSPRRYSSPAARRPSSVSRPATRTTSPPPARRSTSSGPAGVSRPTSVSRPPAASRPPASSGGAPRRVTRH